MANEQPTPDAPDGLKVRLAISGQITQRKEFVNQLDRLCNQFKNGRMVCSISHAPNLERS